MTRFIDEIGMHPRLQRPLGRAANTGIAGVSNGLFDSNGDGVQRTALQRGLARARSTQRRAARSAHHIACDIAHRAFQGIPANEPAFHGNMGMTIFSSRRRRARGASSPLVSSRRARGAASHP
ncbi:hypothetical protein WME99_36465 [Sorangium sp. So ce136]|uniref:hypothetical protein n=1 Tax=Sorangium sp. So ce136 TaxID=3133284 RepID=UPI003F06CD85